MKILEKCREWKDGFEWGGFDNTMNARLVGTRLRADSH
jgi:hypothetical protein